MALLKFSGEPMRSLKQIATLCSIATLVLSAAAFGQSRVSVNPAGIKKFIDDLRSYQPSLTPSDREIAYLQGVLKLGRSVINSGESVDEFNKQHKHDVFVIGKLADISIIDVPDIKVNATLILVDVTENATVCGVLNKLMDKNLPDSSRFNLLQVVRVVSNRLKNIEVKIWMTSMVKQNQAWIGTRQNMDKPQNLLREIERNLTSKTAESKLENDYPSSYKQCRELEHFADLDRAQ